MIASLKERGRRVGALKHGANGFEIDHPGKDSHRLAAAGADATVIVSADKLALVRRLDAEPPVDEILDEYFADADIVLVEGFKRSALPKIEVHRKGRGAGLLCRGARHDPALLAVASDEPMVLDVPVFDLGDPEKLVDFLEKTLIGPAPAA